MQHIISKPHATETQQPQQWQSGSADSSTSASTSTTATSEEYQRMYQAQINADQMQQIYEQSGSEIDFNMDMEVAALQKNPCYSPIDYCSMQSGRKSAHECGDYISGPISTYYLIDLVRGSTPNPEIPLRKAQRKVEFEDDVSEKRKEVEIAEKSAARSVQKIEEDITEGTKRKTSKLRIEHEPNEELRGINLKFDDASEIKTKIPESKLVLPTNIPNELPREWISSMVKALTTAPDKPVTITASSNKAKMFESVHIEEEKKITFQDNSQKLTELVEPKFLTESPVKGSFITTVSPTTPIDSVKFSGSMNNLISLPEESEPYLPPPTDMKPYLCQDFRPKSPLLRALTTAPDRAYTPFSRDVCSQLDDLPTPKEKLTMIDALTIASNRGFAPFNAENGGNEFLGDQNASKQAEHQFLSKHQEVAKQMQPQSETIDTQINRQLSAFADIQGFNVVSPFQPKQESLIFVSSNTVALPPRINSIEPQAKFHTENRDFLQSQQRAVKTQLSSPELQKHQEQNTLQNASSSTTSYHSMIIDHQSNCMLSTVDQISQQKSDETEQKISFPPPYGPLTKRTLLSGLRKPDNIPQYQRNWTVLLSQRPARTPESPELRENVPLAFVDTPRELTSSVSPSPVVTQTTSTVQHDSAAYNAVKVSEVEYHQELKQQQLLQKKLSVPIIVTDMSGPISMAFQSLDDLQDNDHTRAHPRSFNPSLINKPAPKIPCYQTTDKLVAEEYSATQSRPHYPHSQSPLPERARSPAPGLPPNPLKAICAPRAKELENGYRQTKLGSITTGQPQSGSIATIQACSYTGKSYYGNQSARYQTKEQDKIVSHCESGRTLIDKPEVMHQKQIGDMIMKTRTKESQLSESNHSELKSKSTTQVGNMQIKRNQKVVEEFEHNQSTKSVEILKTRGETGQIVKIVTNQACGISDVERDISSITSQSQAISVPTNLNEINSSFPQCASPEPISKFPLKDVLPAYDEPQKPTYVISRDTSKLASSALKYYGSTTTNMASSSSNYLQKSSLSNDQSKMCAAAQSLVIASSLSSSNLTTTSLPVSAFKPPVPFGSVGSNQSDAHSNQPEFITNNQQLPTNTAYKPAPLIGPAGFKLPLPPSSNIIPNVVNDPSPASAGSSKGGVFSATSIPKRGRGILNKAVGPGVRVPLCGSCNSQIRGPFITALGQIWCPDHFVCVNGNCHRALHDIGFVEEKGDLYCEYCFEIYLAPTCNKCNLKIKGDCLNAIGKHFHPECFTCSYCGKVFGNSPFFLEEGEAYCEADWNELFTTKCFACGFPVEAGDRWVEALNHNYHSQCFNCTMCRKNLEGQSFYNKGGRPFCKNHAR